MCRQLLALLPSKLYCCPLCHQKGADSCLCRVKSHATNHPDYNPSTNMAPTHLPASTTTLAALPRRPRMSRIPVPIVINHHCPLKNVAATFTCINSVPSSPPVSPVPQAPVSTVPDPIPFGLPTSALMSPEPVKSALHPKDVNRVTVFMPEDSLTCGYCSTVSATANAAEKHSKTVEHMNNAAAMTMVPHFCEPCDKIIRNRWGYETHANSKKHKNRLFKKIASSFFNGNGSMHISSLLQ